MKNLFISSLILLLVALIACQPKNNDEIPEDLEGKKTYLAEKKSKLRDLQILVDQVETQISELQPEEEKDPIKVNTVKITPQQFKRFVEVQANVIADDVVNVSSDIGGRIINILVREGQPVRKGQLLAVTDMQTIEKQLDEVRTSLNLANIVFERQSRLWEQNIGSEIQYLEAKNNKERLEKSLITIESQIAKKNIYSPISGIVDQEFMEAGETASPGMPILQILNPNKVKISADVQESLLGKVSRGDEVEVYFPSIDHTISKKISMIGRTIDVSNRTFNIEIETSSEKGMLKPNLLSKVRINDYTKEEALVIPLETLREGVDGKKYVFVVDDSDTITRARKSFVDLGESTDGYAVVEKGISDGDRVIVAGTGAISDNYPIEETNQTKEINE